MTKQEIQELKASLSIREVIGRYTKLNRVGRRWMGLCPFHGDRHPSLSVNEEKGSFVCYACGERGDVFAFVSKIENVGFVEAANKLSIDSGQLAIEGKDNKEARLLPERLAIKEKKENSDAEQLPVVNSQLSIENEAFLALLLPAGSGCSELTPTWLDFGWVAVALPGSRTLESDAEPVGVPCARRGGPVGRVCRAEVVGRRSG